MIVTYGGIGQSYGDYGQLIATPGQILDKAGLVDATIESMAAAVEARPPDPSVHDAWITFYNSWKTFYGGLQGVSGWLARLWGGAMTQVDQYQEQANSWRSTLIGAGVPVTTPELASTSFPVKTLVWGAVALGTLYVASQGIGLFKRS
jgi:hypothetical protein